MYRFAVLDAPAVATFSAVTPGRLVDFVADLQCRHVAAVAASASASAEDVQTFEAEGAAASTSTAGSSGYRGQGPILSPRPPDGAALRDA
ncbi:MAG: hypothetical protein F4X99_15905 [Gammaproteobacteria bacterium]|nr:hypothetical protein [Gammaproteobacteria bacterium]